MQLVYNLGSERPGSVVAGKSTGKEEEYSVCWCLGEKEGK